MSDTTYCKYCHASLNLDDRYFILHFHQRNLVSKEEICKTCFLRKCISDYRKKEVFNLMLLRGVADSDLILQQHLNVKLFSKLLAASYKVNEKITELVNKIWFSGSPLREKLTGDTFTIGDVISFRDPFTQNDVTVQKQSTRTVIWLNDTHGSTIELSFDNNNQSLALSNITATLPNTLILLDWMITNHSTIAANLD